MTGRLQSKVNRVGDYDSVAKRMKSKPNYHGLYTAQLMALQSPVEGAEAGIKCSLDVQAADQ